jgi:hypothetical protein
MDPLRCAVAVVLTPLLYFALGFGLAVLGGAIDQPHPLYVQGNWFTHRIGRSVEGGAWLAVVMAVLVGLDLIAQRARGVAREDVAYYPRLGGLRRCLSAMPARIVLVAGLLALAGWFVHTELELRVVEMFAGGMVWPPERVVAAGLVVWGLLWLADCLARPDGGTIVAATGFLLLALICMFVRLQ